MSTRRPRSRRGCPRCGCGSAAGCSRCSAVRPRREEPSVRRSRRCGRGPGPTSSRRTSSSACRSTGRARSKERPGPPGRRTRQGEALRCFRWCDALDPENDVMLKNLGLTYGRLGRVYDSAVMFATIDDESGPRLAGHALLHAEREAEAVLALRYASQSFTTAEEWMALGAAAWYLEDDETAAEAYEEVATRARPSPAARSSPPSSRRSRPRCTTPGSSSAAPRSRPSSSPPRATTSPSAPPASTPWPARSSDKGSSPTPCPTRRMRCATTRSPTMSTSSPRPCPARSVASHIRCARAVPTPPAPAPGAPWRAAIRPPRHRSSRGPRRARRPTGSSCAPASRPARSGKIPAAKVAATALAQIPGRARACTAGSTDLDATLGRIAALAVREAAHSPIDPPPPLGRSA